MKKLVTLALAGLFVVSLAQAQVRGSYMETRTADVYTGQCFANGEVNLTGNEAIMAWQIQTGTWQGVALDGLSAAAVVRAKATLGDPYADPYPARSIIVVDDRATAAQQKALVAFVQHQGGQLFANVEHVERQPVVLEVSNKQGRARMQAGTVAAIETRGVSSRDHVCGNEVTFYQPLTPVEHAIPAVALTDSYQGKHLGETWELHGKRSAFVGTFDTANAGKQVSEHMHHGD
jgi:hypothetical protein